MMTSKHAGQSWCEIPISLTLLLHRSKLLFSSLFSCSLRFRSKPLVHSFKFTSPSSQQWNKQKCPWRQRRQPKQSPTRSQKTIGVPIVMLPWRTGQDLSMKVRLVATGRPRMSKKWWIALLIARTRDDKTVHYIIQITHAHTRRIVKR